MANALDLKKQKQKIKPKKNSPAIHHLAQRQSLISAESKKTKKQKQKNKPTVNSFATDTKLQNPLKRIHYLSKKMSSPWGTNPTSKK